MTQQEKFEEILNRLQKEHPHSIPTFKAMQEAYNLALAESARGWVDIKERLPEFHKYVLVWNGRSMLQACLMSEEEKEIHFEIRGQKLEGIWFDNPDFFGPANDVTHWSPLPQPPAKGGMKV